MNVTDKKRMPKYITVRGIQCPHCLEPIWSRHGHDFRYCFCGYCFIDGGANYTRVGFGWEGELGKTQVPPKSIDLEVPTAEAKYRLNSGRFPY